MSSEDISPKGSLNTICPDITAGWKLGKSAANEFFLIALTGDRRYQFSDVESYALRYFTGQFTIAQVQNFCNQNKAISPDFVFQLLQKLVDLEVLTLPAGKTSPKSEIVDETQDSLTLKPRSQWIQHPAGYWILRNPEDVTFLQVDDRSKAAICDLGQLPLNAIAQKHNLTSQELRHLLQLLTATGMLVGTKPQKPPKGKFTPLKLLFFKLRLFDPDPWLTKHVDRLSWVWTRSCCLLLCFFLAFSGAIALSQQQDIGLFGRHLIATEGVGLILPFALLSLLVITLHELGHAFTLKYYGGIVPEVGLMFMFMMPAAYTNTSDSYCLVKRRQRALVVAAGVLCQLAIASAAFWLWQSSALWLSTTSFLLMAAALFTVAINLNPLSKFDGYYLTVALSGINNLRSRSFGLYANLLQRRPIKEKAKNTWVLAAYAPFSLLYTLFVFGHLLGWLGDFTLSNIPFFSLTLLGLWAIYFYLPHSPKNTASTPMNPSNSEPRPHLKVMQPQTKSASQRGWVRASKRTVTLAAIATSLGLIGFIPTPFDVGGAVQLEAREYARTQIRTPMPAVVQDILVKPGATVKKGQVLAYLSSLELDKDIADIQQKLDFARLQLANAQREQKATTSEVETARAVGQAAKEKATRYGDRAAALTQGQLPPDIQTLEIERTRLQKQLPEIQDKAKRYQELYLKGGISKDRSNDVQTELRNLESQLAAKIKQIEDAKQKLKDMASDRQADANTQTVAIDAAKRKAEAEGVIATQRQAIATLETRFKQLTIWRDSLTLRSPIAGTVLTGDLDRKKNIELRPGADFLLEIADLNSLAATVEVREEDLNYVKIGKPVKFRPLQDKLRSYEAKVEQILPQIKADATSAKRTALVRIIVDNTDIQLRPEGSGYAKIWSESIPLYERLSREFQRLVPLEKFL